METRGIKRNSEAGPDFQVKTTKRNRRQAFTAPYNASTKAIIKRNAMDSPLLNLPAELRSKIWRALLGDRVIHLAHRCRDHFYSTPCEVKITEEGEVISPPDCSCFIEKPKWRHGVCTSEQTELEQFEAWKDETKARAEAEQRGTRSQDLKEGDEFYENPCKESCLPSLADINPDHDHPLETLDLRALRACRQVYVEASPVLWESNTFAFDCGRDLTLFAANRNTVQRQLWKSLRVNLDIDHFANDEWNRAFSMKAMRSLKGLRVLHAHISYDFYQYMVDLWSHEEYRQNTPVAGLLKLMVLPWEVVTATFFNDLRGIGRGAYIKAKTELKFAETLKDRLLDPKGPEVWKKE
ncbi:hypothetical protein MMC30_009248 [Trapelia coarctata]|nr:hypothetical protein [Trapelia coarctata]